MFRRNCSTAWVMLTPVLPYVASVALGAMPGSETKPNRDILGPCHWDQSQSESVKGVGSLYCNLFVGICE